MNNPATKLHAVLVKAPLVRRPGALTAEERSQFLEMRLRLQPAFKAIVDLEAIDRHLTDREYAILWSILQGLSTREIAHRYDNSEKTIKHHVSALFHKFDVGSRAELIARIFGVTT